MVSALTIANKFIERAKRESAELTNIQLQKLVYIAHGWSLAVLNRGLIHDSVEAWYFGPVIPSLYHNLKQYGAGVVEASIPVLSDQSLPSTEQALLNSVWKGYGQMSAFELSTITHRENTPWSRTMKDFGLRSVIPEKYMAEYYRQLYDEQIRRKQQHPQPTER